MNWSLMTGSLLISADLALTFAGTYRYTRADAARYACWALADALGGAAMLWWHIWPLAAGFFGFAAWWLWKWWNRRRGDRAKAWLGAKSRALRDALVRKAREAATPRPLLRPVPGGARCS